MTRYLIRKILVVLIIILPVLYWTGCKKQPKCGCGKDILFTLDSVLVELSSITYNTSGTIATYSVTNAYGYPDTYYFCNPVEMYPAYTSLAGDNLVYLSGDVYYDCQYLLNSSSSSYMSYYKIYNLQVTLLGPWELDGYGKK